MPKSIVAEDDNKCRIRWFSEVGCVVEKDRRYEVLVGRLIVAAWDKDDTSLRNAIVVTLAGQSDIHLGKLARAFRLSPERLRQLRRAFEEGGVRAVTTPARVGRKPKVTPRIRAQLERMFDEGVSIDDAHKKMRRLGRSRIGHVHTAWKKKRAAIPEGSVETMEQATLPGIVKRAVGPRETEVISDAPLATGLTQSGFVQHAGVWVMLALLHARGLHGAAMRVASERASQREPVQRMRNDGTTSIGSIARGWAIAQQSPKLSLNGRRNRRHDLRDNLFQANSEVRMGFEPTCVGFAIHCLTTWLPHQSHSPCSASSSQRRGDARGQRAETIARTLVEHFEHLGGVPLEVDGGIHREPHVAFADRRRQAALESLGLRVLRVSARDVEGGLPARCSHASGRRSNGRESACALAPPAAGRVDGDQFALAPAKNGASGELRVPVT